MKGCQAFAAITGRDYVTAEDVKELAVPVLGHRLIVSNGMSTGKSGCEEVINDILNTVAAPLEKL